MTDRNVLPFPGPRSDAMAGAVPRPLGERDDDELMRLASAGARDAFALLVTRHLARLTSFCIKMIGDRRGGEDVVQETWLKVWSLRAGYRADGKFEAFLFTIARNRCRNALRGARRRGHYQLEVGIDDGAAAAIGTDEPSHIDALLARERQVRVAEALLTLPPPSREALLLRYDQGLEYATIAMLIGRTESAARSRVHHALGLLRAALDHGAPELATRARGPR